jgi:hypothetical protein
LFNVAQVKTSDEIFRAKFLMLHSECRWITLENLLRNFIGEKITEKNNFTSSDLVKVSYQIWDKV